MLSESSRLRWQKNLTLYFRETGDYTSYIMPPCIILPAGYDCGWIDIGDGFFTLSGRIIRISSFWCLEIAGDRLPSGSGFFFSAEERIHKHPSFPDRTVQVRTSAIIETDGTSSRIISRHPLRTDRANGQDMKRSQDADGSTPCHGD